MIIEYKGSSVELGKMFYVECGFYSEKICFVLWEDLMAFMSKTIGFEYTIRTISTDEIPVNTPVYLPHEPSVKNGYTNYGFKELGDVIIPQEPESVFKRFEKTTY